MIYFHLQIDNPFSDRWQVLKSWAKCVSVNKCLELNLYATNQLLEIDLQLTRRQDHAGFKILLGLVHRSIELHFYDTRHWDHFNDTWEIYVNDQANTQPMA